MENRVSNVRSRWQHLDRHVLPQQCSHPRAAEVMQRADAFFFDLRGARPLRRIFTNRDATEDAAKELFNLGKGVDARSLKEYFVVTRGIFQILTTPFLDALAHQLGKLRISKPGPILEICAGDGHLGDELRARGIPLRSVDNQSWHEPLDYGIHVGQMSGAQALKTYQPVIVLGCWVPPAPTDCVDLRAQAFPSVHHYVHIGERDGSCGSPELWNQKKRRPIELTTCTEHSLSRSEIRNEGISGVWLFSKG